MTGVAIVVAVLAVFAAVTLLRPAIPAIDVTAIYFTSKDNACGADSVNWSGYTTSSGASYGLWTSISDPSFSVNCTVTNATALTPGFTITSPTNLPLKIPAGGTQRMYLTIVSPTGTYHGNLTLDIE